MPSSRQNPQRTTESALDMPSMGRALLLASRAARLRCPHCGKGRVLKGFNAVHGHCSVCNFRFCRSDDDYFSGAMFFGMMIGETLAVLAIGAAIWATYPDVPWSFLQYAIPVVLLGVMIVLFPVSRVVWLAIDVMLRPVERSELMDPGTPQPAFNH
ncbi:hypothetical protein BH11GEM1_BH11GEM1_34270 [soil metagenome]